METVKQLIQDLVDRGVSETEIAARLGVAQSTVGRWRRGERTPPLEKLVVPVLRRMLRRTKKEFK
jgi:transcriptional regulator with XRE-family HTH domain